MTTTAQHPPVIQQLAEPSRRACNLVLIANKRLNQLPDFKRVADYVRDYAPEIRTFVVRDKFRPDLAAWLALRPTQVFSPLPMQTFKPWRGRVFCGQNLAKSDEYAALEQAGIAVPRWQLVAPGEKPELAGYSEYVVTKPDNGLRGAMVRIARRGRVRGQDISVGTAKQPSALLVQEFIHTGLWPVSYRVTSLHGKVLWSTKFEASHDRAEITGPTAFGRKVKDSRGINIVASSRGCTISLNFDEEIIRFGEAAHRAFPDIPLLGIDVLRDVGSGKLYIVEVNACGLVWHFSSPMGKRFQQEFGFSLEGQFDGFRLAAKILAEQARLCAA